MQKSIILLLRPLAFVTVCIMQFQDQSVVKADWTYTSHLYVSLKNVPCSVVILILKTHACVFLLKTFSFLFSGSVANRNHKKPLEGLPAVSVSISSGITTLILRKPIFHFCSCQERLFNCDHTYMWCINSQKKIDEIPALPALIQSD